MQAVTLIVIGGLTFHALVWFLARFEVRTRATLFAKAYLVAGLIALAYVVTNFAIQNGRGLGRQDTILEETIGLFLFSAGAIANGLTLLGDRGMRVWSMMGRWLCGLIASSSLVLFLDLMTPMTDYIGLLGVGVAGIFGGLLTIYALGKWADSVRRM
jgi:hypothetical protein